MLNKQRVKICILLFCLALLIRLSFYFIGLVYLPPTLQKFVTADTIFYYDPLALKMASNNAIEVSLLSVTRFTFLNYLAMFYRWFGYHYWPVSVFHCFLGAFSVVFLFILTQLFLKERTAFIIALVATFQIVLVYWTPFVTTETLFLFILSLCLFIFGLFIKTRRLIYIFPLLMCLILVSISRPAGIVFTIFMLLYLEWLVLKKLFNKRGFIYFYTANIIVLISILTFAANFTQKIDKVLSTPYMQQVLQKTLYLDEIPEGKRDKNYLTVHWARLTIPPGINIPKINTIPRQIMFADILSYFKNHYDKYLALVVSRIYTLFNFWVHEYSLKHNVFNTVFYGFIYIFSFLGLFELWRIERAFTILILLVACSQVLIIALTYVDYDFRFRLPLEFILTIPVGGGVAKIFNFRNNS